MLLSAYAHTHTHTHTHTTTHRVITMKVGLWVLMCVNDYKVADRRVYLNSLNQRSDHFAKLQKINGQAYLF